MQHRGVTASASGSGSESESAAASGSASGGESATVALVVVVVAVADDAAEVRYTDEKEEKGSAECGGRAVAMWWSVRETMMRR